MDLTDEDIQSFRVMWIEEFGETITSEAARFTAMRLMDFFLTLAEERLEHSEKE